MKHDELDNEMNEYKDELGEVLRQHSSYRFSWIKTIAFLGGLVIVVIICVVLTLNWAERIFRKQVGPEDMGKSPIYQRQANLIAEPKVTPVDATPTPSPVIQAPVRPKAEAKVTARVTSPPKTIHRSMPRQIQKVVHRSVVPYKVNVPYKVIVGTFFDKANASVYIAQLKGQGMDAFIISSENNGKQRYQVQAGAFHTRKTADEFARSLQAKGISTYIIAK